MILHLTPGFGAVELHVHDGAQVALYQPGDRPALFQADPATKPHAGPRWLVLGLTGAVCLALGYGAALRGSATPASVAAAPVLVRPVAPPPGNIPLPQAAPPARYDTPGIGLPPVRPRAEGVPMDGVPAALAQQLAQPPVVVPPAAPARPATGGSAFGLGN